MSKNKIFNLKGLGIILGLLFFGSILYGQQSQYGQQNQQMQSTMPTEPSSTSQGASQKQLEVEKKSRWIAEEIKKSIIPDAMNVIQETRNAINLIQNGQSNEAQAAIERALGKIDGLLARHPGNALLPIDFNIKVIDIAPANLEVIKNVGKTAETAVKNRDYPDGRLYLNALRSEIDISTYALPLEIYPPALKKALYLLDQKNPNDARAVLESALNAITIVQQSLPIPVIYSKVLVSLAEEQKEKKEIALKLLNLARYELERAMELGYVAKDDQDYISLNDSIKDLEKQINANTSTPSAFQSLKDRIEGFFKRHFGEKKRSVYNKT
jgi:hypothetical protein